MLTVNLDSILWLAGAVAEAVVIGLLVYRRIWQTLPVFFAYNIWIIVGSLGAYFTFRSSHSMYVTTYTVEMVVDSVLLFGVLVELAWSVLRPIHSSLPRMALLVVATLILVAGVAIWPFAAISVAGNASRQLAILMHLQQTVSILRILIFLALAGGSHLLSIGWRNRELQAATGLGFNSSVGVAVSILHSHQTTAAQYSFLDRFVVASYLCTLMYWIVSFSRREEERREFTPQMQSFLLAVAGAARNTRMGVTDISNAKPRKPRPM